MKFYNNMTDYNNPEFDPMDSFRDDYDSSSDSSFDKDLEFDNAGDFGYRELLSNLDPSFYEGLKYSYNLTRRRPK